MVDHRLVETGSNCLLTACVIGCNLDPDPPARIIPRRRPEPRLRAVDSRSFTFRSSQGILQSVRGVLHPRAMCISDAVRPACHMTMHFLSHPTPDKFRPWLVRTQVNQELFLEPMSRTPTLLATPLPQAGASPACRRPQRYWEVVSPVAHLLLGLRSRFFLRIPRQARQRQAPLRLGQRSY